MSGRHTDSTTDTDYHVGCGRAEITAFVPDIGMMGYALPTHRISGIGAPLHSRALAIQYKSESPLVLVCCDLWGITPALRDGVLQKLDRLDIHICPSRLMLTGTHTHSGPGGYSHYLLFNLSIPGFVPEVYNAIVDGIVSAIQIAISRLQPGALRRSEATFDDSIHVAFNRSLRAYNRNEGITPLTAETAHKGVDRTMTSLWAVNTAGHRIASFHWFGVHGCSLHSDSGLIHPDNKGIAATTLEAHAQARWGSVEYVGAFPQTTAGDVSPNFRWNAKRRLQEGLGENDLESAALNGQLQANLAIASQETEVACGGTIGSVIQFVDFRSAPADARCARGCTVARTGPAVLGVRMMSGTADGSGPPPAWSLRPLWWLLNRTYGASQALRRAIRRVFRLKARPNVQGPKVPFMQVGLGARGRLFGLIAQGNPPLPESIDPGLKRIKLLHRKNAQGSGGWVPQVLPLQICCIGTLCIVGLPFEPTTVAGYRLRDQVHTALNPHGIERVVIAGWANAYGGYLTTYEEYQAQQYEGASTYFGQWTLAATQTALDTMLQAYTAGSRGMLPGHSPEHISSEELSLRSHQPG